MKTAHEIAREAGGTVVAGTTDAKVTSWAFDSRVLDPGACFVALGGRARWSRVRSRGVRGRRERGAGIGARARRGVAARGGRGRSGRCVARVTARRGRRPAGPFRPARGRGRGIDRQDLDQGSPRRGARAARLLREPGVVQQRVRSPDHPAQHTRDLQGGRRRDGGALSRRHQSAVRYRASRDRCRHQCRPRARRASRRRRGRGGSDRRADRRAPRRRPRGVERRRRVESHARGASTGRRRDDHRRILGPAPTTASKASSSTPSSGPASR